MKDIKPTITIDDDLSLFMGNIANKEELFNHYISLLRSCEHQYHYDDTYTGLSGLQQLREGLNEGMITMSVYMKLYYLIMNPDMEYILTTKS